MIKNRKALFILALVAIFTSCSPKVDEGKNNQAVKETTTQKEEVKSEKTEKKEEKDKTENKEKENKTEEKSEKQEDTTKTTGENEKVKTVGIVKEFKEGETVPETIEYDQDGYKGTLKKTSNRPIKYNVDKKTSEYTYRGEVELAE